MHCRLADHQFILDFKFPFDVVDEEADVSVRTLGYGQEADEILDPMTNPRTYGLLKQHKNKQVVRNLLASKPQKITLQQYNLLRKVPLNPQLRLTDKPKG